MTKYRPNMDPKMPKGLYFGPRSIKQTQLAAVVLHLDSDVGRKRTFMTKNRPNMDPKMPKGLLNGLYLLLGKPSKKKFYSLTFSKPLLTYLRRK